ncbi:MAG TPA: hypothetical protein VKD28_10730 [Gemmatimonadales bacterium]|nr:hypothetical protein [Gemmatimonadales bacterium]
MSEANRIADLHRRAFDGDSWHGAARLRCARWRGRGAGALAALRETHGELNRAFAALDDAELETVPPGGRRSYYGLAHGAVHQALLHAGQIAILKKG